MVRVKKTVYEGLTYHCGLKNYANLRFTVTVRLFSALFDPVLVMPV